MREYRFGDLASLSADEIEELRKDAKLREIVGIITHCDEPLSKKDQAPIYKLFPTIFNSITNNDMPLFKKLIKTIHIQVINRSNKDGMTFLHMAACCSNRKAISLLLSKGADINLVHEKTGWTALHTAVWFADHKLVDYLVKKGANVNLECKMGQTPLMNALNDYKPKEFKAYQAIIRTLLRNGADPKFSPENAMPGIIRYMQYYIKRYLKK